MGFRGWLQKKETHWPMTSGIYNVHKLCVKELEAACGI